MTDERLIVHCARTHLYPGARLAAGIPAEELGSAPRGLLIVFGDGTEADAELLQNDAGDLAVDMPARTTAAGTAIRPRAWRAAALEEADGSVLLIGERL